MEQIDKNKFGPWAVVTGASSGIGKEFARQLAANGIHVVLVARRLSMLKELGEELSETYGIEYRALGIDLSSDGFLSEIEEATRDLEVGLLVSNAGRGIPGEFLSIDTDTLANIVDLNVMSHLQLTHHFGRQFVEQGRGGVILVSAVGGLQGLPYMANDSATKGYVLNLGEALNVEFKKHGVHVTVLLPGPTETPVLEEFGWTPETSPTKLMSVEQCVDEALQAFNANKPTIIPGLMNRIMSTVLPRSMTTKIMGNMIKSWVDDKEDQPASERQLA